jgi:uncharacterized protein (TIGR02722 family)
MPHPLPKIAPMLALCALTSACAAHPPVVRRVDAQTQTDLSGTWNDTDAHLTGQALIRDCFAATWMADFTREQKRRPTLRVASIVNKTDEHIDAQVFIKNIEAAIIESGRARVLAQAGLETSAIDIEQARAQSGRQGADTAVKAGRELGADFVVAVTVSSIVDQIEGRSTKFYKVSVELISPTTGEKSWLGSYEIKKLIGAKNAKW